MQKLEVVIPLLDNDLPTFKIAYNYLLENLPCKEIVLIGNEKLRQAIGEMCKVRFVNEDSLIPGLTFESVRKLKLKLSGTKRRTGWYFQQFLKMAYSFICQEEYYLVWDADTIPINQINFFHRDHPYLAYRDFVSEDKCYDKAQNLLLPNGELKKSVHISFIAEHMLFNVSIMREFIRALESNDNNSGVLFYEKIMNCIPKKYINLSGFSEFEAYAAYVIKFHKNFYELRKWNNCRDAVVYVGKSPNMNEIQWIRQRFDTISIENFYNQWFICRVINYLDQHHNIPFKSVYSVIHPLVNIEMQLRSIARSVIKR